MILDSADDSGDVLSTSLILRYCPTESARRSYALFSNNILCGGQLMFASVDGVLLKRYFYLTFAATVNNSDNAMYFVKMTQHVI